MLGLIAAVYLSSTLSPNAPSFEPTVNLSAVRQIDCASPTESWQGSGYMTSKNTIFSVLHVADDGVCYDHASGVRLNAYYKDKLHDFVIFSGDVPLRGPYLKYSCEPFHAGETYLAYGYSGIGYEDDQTGFYDSTIFRQYSLTGTGTKTDSSFTIGKTPEPGLSLLNGRTAPGTSGGPIVDLNGYIHGGVNVGVRTVFGFPMGPTWSYALHDTSLCTDATLKNIK